MSSLHEGFQATDQPADTEAIFGWLDSDEREPSRLRSAVVDAPDPALTRRIAEVLDAAVPHPWIGRQLFGLFRRACVTCESSRTSSACRERPGSPSTSNSTEGTIDRARQAGQVAAEEVAAWWAALEQAGETEMFFTAVLGFIAVGNKP